MTQGVDAALPPAGGQAGTADGRDAAPFPRTQQAVGAGMLLAGVAALGMVDLVFAVATGWVLGLFAGGALLVAVGWLTLAVLGAKRLLAATAVVAASYVALTAIAPATRALSWRMLVAMNREELAAAVRLLEPVAMTRELHPRGADLCTRLPGLPAGDCPRLQEAMNGFGAHDAWKEGTVAVFETYHTFNARGGLMYCPRGDCGEAPGQYYPRYRKHVEGAWYRWAQ